MWKKMKRDVRGRWFKYDGFKEWHEILHWMNRALSPLLTINEAARVKEFVDINKEFED